MACFRGDELLSFWTQQQEYMRKTELKAPYLWLLFLLWVVWGQFVAYCVLNNLVPSIVLEIADAIGGFVPSISRLKDEYTFGLLAARRIAFLALAMTPILFLLLLCADVEDSISGVRKKGMEAKAIAMFSIVGLGVFVAGFGGRVPGFPVRVFHTSTIAFSFLASLITYISPYVLRVAWCLRFKR